MAGRLIGILAAAACLRLAVAHAQSTDLNDYVVYATQEARLQRSVTVRSGRVGSNGTLKLQSHVAVQQDVVADVLSFGTGAYVNNDAYYNSLFRNQVGIVLGHRFSPVTLPFPMF